MRKTGSETSTGQEKCQSVYSDPIHGKGVDVHEFNTTLLEQSIEQLRDMWELAAH